MIQPLFKRLKIHGIIRLPATTALTVLAAICAPVFAENIENSQVNSGLPAAVDETKSQAQACLELLQTIRHTDCGTAIYKLFDGGSISLGVSWYSLSMKATKEKIVYAEFMGETKATPHYSISTRPNYFKDSGFGYEYSATIVQAYTTLQGIESNKKRVAFDLGSYVVASMYAAQANLFYAIGANDETPKKYFRAGFGLGAGYADVKGKLYVTEQQTTVNPTCAQAVADLGAGDNSAVIRVRQNCTYESFVRYGLGVSARLLVEARFNDWLMTVQSSVVDLPLNAGLVRGQSTYDFNPATTFVTIAYLFDL